LPPFFQSAASPISLLPLPLDLTPHFTPHPVEFHSPILHLPAVVRRTALNLFGLSVHLLGRTLAKNGICVLGRGFGVAACEHPAGGNKEREE
jgi:hypothetical protein